MHSAPIDPVILNFLDFDSHFVVDRRKPLQPADPFDVAQAKLHVPHLASRQNLRDRQRQRAIDARALATELAGIE